MSGRSLTTIPPLLVGWFVVVLCFVPLLVFAIVTVVRRTRHDRDDLSEASPTSEAQAAHAKYVEPPRSDPHYGDPWQVQPPPRRPAGRYDEPAGRNGPMSPAAPPGSDRPARHRRPETGGDDWRDDRW